MHIGKKAQKREKSAMSVSLYGNLVFVVIELLMAIFTGSQAVLLDAVYDGVEFCFSLFHCYTAHPMNSIRLDTPRLNPSSLLSKESPWSL